MAVVGRASAPQIKQMTSGRSGEVVTICEGCIRRVKGKEDYVPGGRRKRKQYHPYSAWEVKAEGGWWCQHRKGLLNIFSLFPPLTTHPFSVSMAAILTSPPVLS